MAVLISCATGNWLTASTWALVDSTSYSNSETTTAIPPTSAGASARSSTFTPGAITVDAIAIKMAGLSNTTGTLTTNIYNSTGAADVAGTSVTINKSDLNATFAASLDGGWITFKFASPVTLIAATAYAVQVVASNATGITVFVATGTNWSRALRTTTTQAPVAGDDTIVAGEHTGAGTGNNFTVTMNETATTDYGSNSTSPITPALAICKRGSLKFNDASAANPKLRLSGHAIVYNGGTLNMGTVATPIPRDSTAILEFDCTADGDFGLVARNGSIVNLQGLSRTSGKNVCKCLLAADASASGGAPSTSTLTVDTDTGWLSGDQVAIASTSQTVADCETGTLTTNADSSSIIVNNMTVGAAGTAVPPTSNRGLLVAHSGTNPTQAEIILLTRNVRVRTTNATLMSFVSLAAGSNVDIDWVEFYYVGSSIAGKRGVEVEYNIAQIANVSIQFSSIHDCENFGYYALVVTAAAAITTAIFSDNTMWNLATISGPGCQFSGILTATNWTISNNILIRTGNSGGWTLQDIGGVFANNIVAGAATNAFSISEAAEIGTFSGNTAHSNNNAGMFLNTAGMSGTIASFTCWRNNVGLNLAAACLNLTFDTPILFGNVGSNIQLGAAGGAATFKTGLFSGDTSISTSAGLNFTQTGSNWDVVLDNCDLSTVSGIRTAHTTGDIVLNVAGITVKVTARNTKFGAATEISPPSNLASNGFVASQKHDQTAGNHKTWMRSGTVQTDASTFNTAAPSLLMTPTSATIKLESAPQFQGLKVAVNNGSTATISCYARKSAAYNGNQPRLIQKANPALGQSADVVLATLIGGTGSWIQMSGTTSSPTDDGAWEIVVDCDGTAGVINLDDFTVS